MKYQTRAGLYKASNVTFNPSTNEAFSYDWWKFVKTIGQLTVFNSYPYSVSTRRHQYKVKRLLQELGIQIHADIEAPLGLDRLDTALGHYQSRLSSLKGAMIKPRIRQATKDKIEADIVACKSKIKQVNNLMKMKGA